MRNRTQTPDPSICCNIAGLGLGLAKKAAGPGVRHLDFMQHRQFESFADYCYQDLLQKKIA